MGSLAGGATAAVWQTLGSWHHHGNHDVQEAGKAEELAQEGGRVLSAECWTLNDGD